MKIIPEGLFYLSLLFIGLFIFHPVAKADTVHFRIPSAFNRAVPTVPPAPGIDLIPTVPGTPTVPAPGFTKPNTVFPTAKFNLIFPSPTINPTPTTRASGQNQILQNPVIHNFFITTPLISTQTFSLWDDSTVPSVPSTDVDPNAVELGVQFKSSSDGLILGVKFYKGETNTGTHIGNLWASDGTNLATATFTGESATGWQTVFFSSPVAITADTRYIASYHTEVGNYAYDKNYFDTGHTNSPLYAYASGEVLPGNGIYKYGNGGFPTDTAFAANYWVDVLFAYLPTSTPTPSPTLTPTNTPTLTPTPTVTPTPTGSSDNIITNNCDARIVNFSNGFSNTGNNTADFNTLGATILSGNAYLSQSVTTQACFNTIEVGLESKSFHLDNFQTGPGSINVNTGE